MHYFVNIYIYIYIYIYKVMDMTKHIKMALMEGFESSEWIDESTKSIAKEKVYKYVYIYIYIYIYIYLLYSLIVYNYKQ